MTEKRKRYVPGVDIDRRKGRDPVTKTINGLAVACWILLFFSLLVLDQAQPKLLAAHTEWNTTLLGILYQLLFVVFVMSVVGLVLNRRRHRRKTDMFRLSLVISLAISLFGMLRYTLDLLRVFF